MNVYVYVSDLLGAVLLHAAVDVAESGSGQHVGRLLVDQRVKVSLDLGGEKKKKTQREKEKRAAQHPVRAEAAL